MNELKEHLPRISAKERELFDWIVKGYLTDKELAERTGKKIGTIGTQVCSIMHKLHCSNRGELLRRIINDMYVSIWNSNEVKPEPGKMVMVWCKPDFDNITYYTARWFPENTIGPFFRGWTTNMNRDGYHVENVIAWKEIK